MALVFQSLDTVNATGPGSENFFDTPKSNISFQVVFTGSSGDATVALEGTVDGSTWRSLTSTSAPSDLRSVSGTALVGVRANVTDISGGSDISAWIAAA